MRNKKHLDPRKNHKGCKNIQNPLKSSDDLGAQPNHDCSHDNHPQKSTRCWYFRGIENEENMSEIRKILSRASDFSTRKPVMYSAKLFKHFIYPTHKPKMNAISM